MTKKPKISAKGVKKRRRGEDELQEFNVHRKCHPMMAELYRRAEARLGKGRKARKPLPAGAKSEADAQRLLHELQVHQIELEMQNAELKEARDQAEALLEKYTDLYDFAPVGYFSLDDQGGILEVNLTGAALLGVERSRLIGQPLPRFVAPASRPIFLAFLEKVFAQSHKQVCEVSLLRKDGLPFWVDLQAAFAVAHGDARPWCRVAASDITPLKRAEEAQRRLEALSAMNAELNREIVQRRAVEAALKQSEQHQSQLLKQSHQLQKQLRHLSHRMLQAQEEERKRISRELHDEIAQVLVGINVHLEALSKQPDVPSKGFKKKIVQTQRLVEKSVNIVHRFARELRPPLLDELGLIATLHSFLKDFMKQTGIRVQFTTFAGLGQLSSAKSMVVYRLLQSALTNVAQHAQASQVKVSIRKRSDAVELEIADNGKSFDAEEVLFARGHKPLGLLGMRERVEMAGGNLTIQAVPGQGTTIRAQIPFHVKTGRRTKPKLTKPAKAGG